MYFNVDKLKRNSRMIPVIYHPYKQSIYPYILESLVLNKLYANKTCGLRKLTCILFHVVNVFMCNIQKSPGEKT